MRLTPRDRRCGLAAGMAVLLAIACGDRGPATSGGGGGGGSAAGSGSGGAAGASGVAGVAGAGGAAGGGTAGAGGADDAGCLPVAPPHRLAVSAQTGCALDTAGRAWCWGESLDSGTELLPPPAPMKDVSLAGPSSVFVEAGQGYLINLGDTVIPPIPVQAGLARAVTSDSSICVIEECGAARCWGRLVDGAPGRTRDIGIGVGFACAVETFGTISCWGTDSHGEGVLEPPPGAFRSISLGYAHACALFETGEIACWGRGDPDDPTDGSDPRGAMWGQAIPPSGTYRSVCAGTVHSCAIRDSDASIVCWGAGKTNGNCTMGTGSIDECGMSLPPAGRFAEVACGFTHTCGMREDGTVECWGSNTGGRATPPPELR